MQTPPKYPRTMHWPWSKTIHADDKVHQNPEHFVGKEVVITEKLDGGNTCLHNGEVYARSTGQPSHAGWMAMVRKHHAWKTVGLESAVFYGEDIYGIHSIEYDAVPEDETFRLFAVYEYDIWSSWQDVVWMATINELPVVPKLFEGTFSSTEEITEWFEDNINQPSVLGPAREGFVIRTADQFTDFSKNVCKYVRPNHVQTDEHWTRNWQPCQLRKD